MTNPKEGMIGGPDLVALVTATNHGAPSPDVIGLTVNAEALLQGGGPVPMRMEQALNVIQKDLASEKSNPDGFVSIRIHLPARVYRVSKLDAGTPINVEEGGVWAEPSAFDGILSANETVLAESLEVISLPSNIYAFLQVRTTVGMHGLDVTPTNMVVPGFKGPLHLLLRNCSSRAVFLPKFFPAAELFFFRASGNYSGASPSFEVREVLSKTPPKPTGPSLIVHCIVLLVGVGLGLASFVGLGFQTTIGKAGVIAGASIAFVSLVAMYGIKQVMGAIRFAQRLFLGESESDISAKQEDDAPQ